MWPMAQSDRGKQESDRSLPLASRQESLETVYLTPFCPHRPTGTIGLVMIPYSPLRGLNPYGSV